MTLPSLPRPKPERVVLDPGLGFGKSVSQNYELLARTSEIAALGFPVLVGASRKSFLGSVSGRTDPEQRIICKLPTAPSGVCKNGPTCRYAHVRRESPLPAPTAP